MGNIADELYYCTYCEYYGRRVEGTRRDMVAHSYSHPLGDPRDSVLPVGSRDGCPACGKRTSRCDGHTETESPVLHTILHLHDNDVHTECHVSGCQQAARAWSDVGE